MQRRFTPTARIAAVIGSAGLALATLAPPASAQHVLGSINPDSLGDLRFAQASLESAPKSIADLTGGGLASLGLGGLGSAVAGGDCVAIDPAFGSSSNTLDMEVTNKDGAPGMAHVKVRVSGGGSSSTELVFHWRNLDSGAAGNVDVPVMTIGGGGGYGDLDVETGMGTVEWHVEARQNAVPLSVGLALGAIGSTSERVPGSSTPFSNCGGTAEIA
ncbi:MAG: hypothetical protein Q4G67_15290 [Actinomycetia bacterium]|nr:hypothetical protein [Actinomycetes bacterium]